MIQDWLKIQQMNGHRNLGLSLANIILLKTVALPIGIPLAYKIIYPLYNVFKL